MREKPVSQERIDKYIDFLFVVKNNSEGTVQILTLSEIAKNSKVSSSAPSALEKLNIIEKKSKFVWIWKSETRPSKTIALKVLDFLLHKNKKTVHYPIPEFAGIAESLEHISERLIELAVQNEKWLRAHKNGLKSNEQEATDLFRIDDQELYIAGQIASALYKPMKICNHEFIQVQTNERLTNITSEAQCRFCGLKPNSTMIDPALTCFEDVNEVVIKATKDLINKLRNKELHQASPHVFINVRKNDKV